MRRHQECALVSRDLADCSESLVWPRPGHIYFYFAVFISWSDTFAATVTKAGTSISFSTLMIISSRSSTNQCLSLVTSHINLVQLSQEAHESCFSRRPRKGSPVCESHLLHWEGREGASQPLADTVRGGGVLLGREEQPPCEQTCSRATFPIPDFRTQQDETKRT